MQATETSVWYNWKRRAMQRNLLITRAHVDKDGFYDGPSLGLHEGSVYANARLGPVKFRGPVNVTGEFILGEGTGFEALTTENGVRPLAP
jgi:hypothetical protein